MSWGTLYVGWELLGWGLVGSVGLWGSSGTCRFQGPMGGRGGGVACPSESYLLTQLVYLLAGIVSVG